MHGGTLYTLHLSAQVSPDMCGAKVNTLVSVPGVLTASVLCEAEVWKVRKANFGSQPRASSCCSSHLKASSALFTPLESDHNVCSFSWVKVRGSWPLCSSLDHCYVQVFSASSLLIALFASIAILLPQTFFSSFFFFSFLKNPLHSWLPLQKLLRIDQRHTQ